MEGDGEGRGAVWATEDGYGSWHRVSEIKTWADLN